MGSRLPAGRAKLDVARQTPLGDDAHKQQPEAALISSYSYRIGTPVED